MFQSSLSHKKLKQIDIRKNHHYYLNAPYQISVLTPEQQKFEQQNESVNSQQSYQNNSYTQYTEDLYFRKHSKLFRDLRSTSNQNNNNQLNNINQSFIFRIKSKNHLQEEPLILDNLGQRDKDKKTKDLVKVLHEMKKKRQKYIQKEQFIPRSPIPLLKRQNCIYLDEPQVEKLANHIKTLPIINKREPGLNNAQQNDTQSNFQKLTNHGNLEEQFQSKLISLQQFIFQLQCNYLLYVKQSQVRQQTYFIEEINQNDQIIMQLMKKRWWWCESLEKSEDVQFYWSQKLNQQILQKQQTHALFDITKKRVINPQIINNHEEFLKFAQEQKLTFIQQNSRIHNHLDLYQIFNLKKNLLKFINKYQTLANEELQQFFPYSINVANIQDPQFNIYQIKYKLTNSLWLVKPGEQLNNHSQIKLCQNTKQVSDFITSELKNSNRVVDSFIIQQYIKPFLYQKRKFDICAYILITSFNGIVRVYFYDEVIGRTSSKEYSDNDLDPLTHFTNSQIQKECKSFSLYESGNKLSTEKLQEFFKQFKINFREIMISKFKRIATNIFKSMFTQMVLRDYNFEIVGLNFIVDTALKPWLIDANLNPSLIPDCPFHQKFLTQLLDSVFQYTLDLLHPPPLNWPQNKKQLIENFTIQDRFSVIFDSRFDSEILLELYQKDIN
ncbi:unnamed protein product (macronuclear) [Paramecium tetraurelia]|uniref:Tubulin-tyrosine ligase family protein n=1 Tax=Paramecium tetraurelia TaxID=5888 RepID=A0BCW9_PARTE|nr:uncharacterized protein GSPATT00004480001 [Paramecium tetraurelia]CAK56386.1 unnamed protein product [Paramecium tetraurelia]|eukprot:XP_001423784.1 hypothetical protein (macronuclear) [Paramecium tetraurelia strain d4-2]